MQVVFGYLMTRWICVFIQNPRTRVRMWGSFLLLTTLAWLFLWIPNPAGGPFHFPIRSASLQATSDLHVAFPVKSLWASYATKLATMAWGLYLFLAVVSLLHLRLKSVRLKALLRRTQNPSPQLQALFRRLCIELRIGRCELGIVSRLRSPATCGWPQSHVLLPLELVHQLDGDQLSDILRHELIHVRQHDYLWDRLAALGCRLVFFHPLVWMGYRRLRWERELACDHFVIEKRPEERLRYAECLTKLAEWLVARSNPSEGIGFSSPESLLAVRVRALLSEPSSYSAHQKAARAGLVATMAGFALVVVPSLGLTLYSPVRLATLLARPRNAHSYSAWMKPPSAKSMRSSIPRALTAETPVAPQLAAPHSVNFGLEFQTAPLPVLVSATTAKNVAETTFTYRDEVNHDGRLQGSRPVWDEAPMPLASPPKWRGLVIGAITGGVGIATGRIDVDDVDGPRKKSR